MKGKKLDILFYLMLCISLYLNILVQCDLSQAAGTAGCNRVSCRYLSTISGILCKNKHVFLHVLESVRIKRQSCEGDDSFRF